MALKGKVRKINVLTEMRRLRRKLTDPSDRHTLDWALEWAKAGLAQAELEQLERLYRLEDLRG